MKNQLVKKDKENEKKHAVREDKNKDKQTSRERRKGGGINS